MSYDRRLDWENGMARAMFVQEHKAAQSEQEGEKAAHAHHDRFQRNRPSHYAHTPPLPAATPTTTTDTCETPRPYLHTPSQRLPHARPAAPAAPHCAGPAAAHTMLRQAASRLLGSGIMRSIATSAARLEGEAAPAGIKEFTEAWNNTAPSTLAPPEFPTNFLAPESSSEAATDGERFAVNFYTPHGVVASTKVRAARCGSLRDLVQQINSPRSRNVLLPSLAVTAQGQPLCAHIHMLRGRQAGRQTAATSKRRSPLMGRQPQLVWRCAASTATDTLWLI